MDSLTVFVTEFDGARVRSTNDGRFSVYDVLVAFGVCTTRKAASVVYSRIIASNPEGSTFCSTFKFPGRGQNDTPIANEEGIYQILMLCPGRRGAEFRKWAAKVVKERVEENANPELAYTRGRERAIKAWKRQGKTDKEIQQQIKGIEARCEFTDTLKEHGVLEGWQYAQITNVIYETLFDAPAAKLKEQRGLKKKDRLRDSFDMVESLAGSLAEALAAKEIDEKDSQGYHQCKNATSNAANRVRRVFDK